MPARTSFRVAFVSAAIVLGLAMSFLWLGLGRTEHSARALAASTVPASVVDGPVATLTADERAWLQDHPVIRVAQDPAWAPVEFADSQGRPSGMSEDYLLLLEQRLGIRFERVTGLSWQEAYERLKRWEIDMTTSVAATAERLGFWAFTKPYLEIPIGIFTRLDVAYIGSLAELAGEKVAVVDGYVAGGWIARDFPAIQLVKVATVEDGLDLLRTHEVSAFVDNLFVAGYYMTALSMSDLKVAGQTRYTNAQCMAVRKDWAPLAGILQKGLDSISATDRAAIYSKWVPVRYEKGFNYTALWWALGAFIAIAGGLFTWIWALSKEVKRRRSAETATEASEERFRKLFEGAAVPLCFVSRDGVLTDRNDCFVRMFGYDQDDISTLAEWWERAYPDAGYRRWVKQTWDNAVDRAAREDADIEPIEYQVTCKDGAVRSVIISGSLIGDDYLATFFDITERRRAVEALRQSEQRFRETVVNLDEGWYSADLDGVVLEHNQSFCRILGFDSPEDLTGSLLPDFLQRPEERGAYLALLIAKGSVSNYRIDAKKRTGEAITLLASTHLIKDEEERPLRIEGVFLDLTEQLRLSSQLRQAQKMESVGRLAGGVAHDYNNMLNVILGYTELALEKVDPSEPLHTDLEQVHKAAQRSSDLTRQLLAFAHKQTIAPKVLNLNPTVEGMLNMLARLIGEDISLAWVPGRDLWPVKVDPAQVDQVLANLCLNARDAISGAGEITIQTGNVSLDESDRLDRAGLATRDYVFLTVSDDGRGMDEETREKIFEPFFTTKELGRGTGLGLATVYGIVAQNNGFIEVRSELGKGSVFTIYLPRHEGAMEDAPAASSADMPRAREGETVLVVEDEPSLLNLAERMLGSLGYRVLTAPGPTEALAVAEEYAPGISLLVTDVVMPETSGRELVGRMQSLRPGLACLYMSGYTADVIENHGVLDEGVHFLQKPFSVEQLAVKVREALGG